uniref:Uncharacterized protein n=1 Tax=uncultured Desulfobacterium sp. TaxID=201089 RepID=E1YIS5_9BACT|nr:unknown protein [uncultured Desulfobacterium sp.]CBX31713.1 unknown protein [uncultured Desulfobacterium sp.]
MRNKIKVSNIKKLECDIGYVKKSPCRDCRFKKQLPDCSENCKIINQLQATLVDVISCSNNYSELEAFSLSYQNF